jgi:acyl-CoA synthetase (AMP-forming)/AMP-acid ligase II
MSTKESSRLETRTIIEILHAHAGRTPDKDAYIFLPENPTSPRPRLSYRDLVERTETVAAGLDALFSARPGIPRMALLLFPAGIDFLIAFWACLRARVIAIPAEIRRPGRPATGLEALVDNAGVRLVLTEAGHAEALGRVLASAPGLGSLTPMVLDDLLAGGPRQCPGPLPNAEDIALLQYTSGSTSRPKGVIVRHRNLMANERMIADVMDLHDAGPVVNWMPHYHDMGLIGTLIQPIYLGSSCTTMAPTTFVRRPLRWLKAISEARASLSGGPDFSYRLCVERIQQDEALDIDLSCWRVAFVGAEPVRSATLKTFADRFARYGFRPEALYPCYGMAETTLLAAGSRAGSGAAMRTVDALALSRRRAMAPRGSDTAVVSVCSGWAPESARIAIVDPDTRIRQPDGAVGEIWAAGAHVSDGYYNDIKSSEEGFGARIAEEDDANLAGAWLRTGDLGFIADGGLHVTGRLKEVMIVNGRNLYPHDARYMLCDGMPELTDAAVFAAPRPDGSERIVAVLEIASRLRGLVLGRTPDSDSALRALAETARRVCATGCDLTLDHIRFTLPGGIPKTGSGKIRYGELRSAIAALAEGTVDAPISVETLERKILWSRH